MAQCLRAKNHLELCPIQRLSFKRSLWNCQPYFEVSLARLQSASLQVSPLCAPFAGALLCLNFAVPGPKSLEGDIVQAIRGKTSKKAPEAVLVTPCIKELGGSPGAVSNLWICGQYW